MDNNVGKFSDGKTCLTPSCGEPAKWKGLCQSCYGGAKTLIDAGETSWDVLMTMGLCAIRGHKFVENYRKLKQEKSDET